MRQEEKYVGLKAGIAITLLLFLSLLAVLLLKAGVLYGLAFSVLPLLLGLLLLFMKKPLVAFYAVFVANYLIMGITRYVKGLPGGIAMDGLLLLLFAIILIRAGDGYLKGTKAIKPLLVLTGIWLVYCSLLLFVPSAKLSNWATGVRGIAAYLFVLPLLVSFLIRKYSAMKNLLLVWSVLSLLAVLKALIQKYAGFDPFEKYWLYVEEGSRTHIIYSGIRYFSFFTDAASFGCSMGLSMVFFSTMAWYESSKPLKLYLLFVALASGYAMMMSGTRAAMIVPFVGYAVAIVLSKQWKVIVPGVLLILAVFFFFKYTNLGAGNAEIRRMRTAFYATEDASYQVRQENQAKMNVFMDSHPFGIGIGNAKRSEAGDFMYQLPTDTSLVLIWVETGIVGLVLFLSIFLFTLGRGAWDALFRIKNKELRGSLIGMTAGVAGMIACAYGNEMLQQFPNGPILYICMAFIFLGRTFDHQLMENAHEKA